MFGKLAERPFETDDLDSLIAKLKHVSLLANLFAVGLFALMMVIILPRYIFTMCKNCPLKMQRQVKYS